MAISAVSFATRSARAPFSKATMDSLRCLIIFSSTEVICASSSVMRSSTSRCLMAACKRRMTARRSFSPDRIAVFMSSVMRSLSDKRAALLEEKGSARARPRAVFARAVALEVTLHGGSLLALTLLRRLLIEFAASQLGEHARFFARALETAQGGIEIFVFSYANARHRNLNPLICLEFCHNLPGAGVAIL